MRAALGRMKDCWRAPTPELPRPQIGPWLCPAAQNPCGSFHTTATYACYPDGGFRHEITIPYRQQAAEVLTFPPAWHSGERPSRTLRAVKNGGLRPSLTAAHRNAPEWAGRDGGMVLQSNKGMDA